MRSSRDRLSNCMSIDSATPPPTRTDPFPIPRRSRGGAARSSAPVVQIPGAPVVRDERASARPTSLPERQGRSPERPRFLVTSGSRANPAYGQELASWLDRTDNRAPAPSAKDAISSRPHFATTAEFLAKTVRLCRSRRSGVKWRRHGSRARTLCKSEQAARVLVLDASVPPFHL
jgi:hypothetical protein